MFLSWHARVTHQAHLNLQRWRLKEQRRNDTIELCREEAESDSQPRSLLECWGKVLSETQT
jgi:hypothetical protein